MRILNLNILASLFLLALMVFTPYESATAAIAPVAAGTIDRLRGTATATAADGTQRTLAQGGSVYAGDMLYTGSRRGTFIQLTFSDGTKFALGRDAKFAIQSFVYKKNAEEDKLSTRIFKGAFRFVSGLIAKRRPRSMGVALSVATIGIRGTAVGGEVQEESARVVLMDLEDPNAPNAIEVSNQYGSVTIEEAGYGTEIPDANSPPSAPRRMRLRTIQNLMRTLQSLGRGAPTMSRPHMH
jgi:hypothetical protein